jgi:phage gpG-like protein
VTVNNAAREVADRLRAIRAKAAAEAPRAACEALGRTAETAVKVTLTSSTHPPGTLTPSRPGQPPSLITGTLRRSIARTPVMQDGTASFRCLVGSKLIYAPVHEFGPVTITARNFPQLGNPKVGFFGRSVVIPQRPFIATAVRGMESTGIAHRVTTDAWRAVMDF